MRTTNHRKWIGILTLAAACASDGEQTEHFDEDESSRELLQDEQSLHSLDGLFTPGLRVLPRGELTTSEAGGRDRVWIALRSPPRATVQVTIEVSDPEEVLASAEAITFGRFDWWLPRQLTVSGQQDYEADGDAAFDLTLSTESSDERYGSLGPVVLTGTNREAAAFQLLSSTDGTVVMEQVNDLSNDGKVAAGIRGAAPLTSALRWQAGEGLTILTGEWANAAGVSADGQVVVGSISDVRYYRERTAVAWRYPSTAPQAFQAPPDPPYLSPLIFAQANAIAPDGVAYGWCLQYGAYGDRLACRVGAAEGGWQIPGSVVNAISSDGSRWVGTREPTRYGPPTTIAISQGEELLAPSSLGCLPPRGCGAQAHDVSDSGNVVVGVVELWPTGSTSPAPEAPNGFVYDGAWSRLPDLPGGAESSSAQTVSSDGSVIGGFATDETGQVAVLWRNREPISVRRLLSEGGSAAPEGFQMREVVALSSDGRTFVGNGSTAAGEPRAFRVVLP